MHEKIKCHAAPHAALKSDPVEATAVPVKVGVWNLPAKPMERIVYYVGKSQVWREFEMENDLA